MSRAVVALVFAFILLALVVLAPQAAQSATSPASPVERAPAASATGTPFCVHLPAVQKSASSLPSGTIIVDHTTTDISRIPDYWNTQAKQITFHCAHTAHGSQIISGLQWLNVRSI